VSRNIIKKYFIFLILWDFLYLYFLIWLFGVVGGLVAHSIVTLVMFVFTELLSDRPNQDDNE